MNAEYYDEHKDIILITAEPDDEGKIDYLMVLDALANAIDFCVYDYEDGTFGVPIMLGNDYPIFEFDTDDYAYTFSPDSIAHLRMHGSVELFARNCPLRSDMFVR